MSGARRMMAPLSARATETATHIDARMDTRLDRRLDRALQTATLTVITPERPAYLARLSPMPDVPARMPAPARREQDEATEAEPTPAVATPTQPETPRDEAREPTDATRQAEDAAAAEPQAEEAEDEAEPQETEAEEAAPEGEAAGGAAPAGAGAGEAPAVVTPAAGPGAPGVGRGAGRASGAGGGRGDQLVAVPLPETGTERVPQRPLVLPPASAPFDAPRRFALTPLQQGKDPTPELERQAALFDAAIAAAARFAAALLADAARDGDAAQSAERRRADARQSSLDRSLGTLDRALEESRAQLGVATDAVLALIDRRARLARMRIGGAARRADDRRTGMVSRIDDDLEFREDWALDIEEDADARHADVQAQGDAGGVSLAGLAADPAASYPLEGTAMVQAQNEAIIARLPPRATERGTATEDAGAALFRHLQPAIETLHANATNAFAPFDSMRASLEGAAKTAITGARDRAWTQVRETRTALRDAVQQGRASAEAGLVKLHDDTRRKLVDAARVQAEQEQAAAERATGNRISTATGLAASQGAAVRAVLGGLEPERKRPPAEFATVVGRSARAFADRIAANEAVQRPRLNRAVPQAMGMLDANSAATSRRMQASAADAGHSMTETAEATANALRQVAEDGTASFARVAQPVADSIKGYIDPIERTYNQTLIDLDTGLGDAEDQLDDAFAGRAGSGGGGDSTGPPPAAEADAPTEAADDFVDRVAGIIEDPTTEDAVSRFADRARGVVRLDIQGRSAKLERALPGALGPNVALVMEALRELTALQAGALIAFHPGGNLPTVVDQRLQVGFRAPATKTHDRAAAAAYLAGRSEEGALNEMQSATNWWNDAARVEAAQRSLSPAQMTALGDMPGAGEILDEIADDLGGKDAEVFSALREATPEGVGRANAVRLEGAVDTARDIHGQRGIDQATDALAAANRTAGNDRISGADQFAGLEPDGASEARRLEIWRNTVGAFAVRHPLPDNAEGPRDPEAALVAYATRTITYSVDVPDESRSFASEDKGGTRTRRETRHDTVTGHNRTLIDDIVRHGHDSPQARGSRMAVEMNRAGGPDLTRLRIATDDTELNPALTGGDTAEGRHRREVAQARADEAAMHYWRYTHPDATGPPPPPDTIRGEMQATLRDRLGEDTPSGRYAATLLRDPRANSDDDYADAAVTAFDYALSRPDVDMSTMRAAFAALSFDQAELANRRFNEAHPNEPSLYARLGIHGEGSYWGTLLSDRAHSEGRLSGDEMLEMERISHGTPTNDRERFTAAALSARQQMRESGWLGRLLAADEYGRLRENYENLLELGEVDESDFDSTGRLRIRDPTTGERVRVGRFEADGTFVPPVPGSTEEFEAAMDLARLSAETYTQAADRIATSVATAIVVVAAVVTTVLTAGAAASIWIPVLVTAGAGLVGMGLSASIKGGRYSRDEMARDLAMTVITAATAGIGAAAGTALRGGMPALRAAAGSLRVSEGAMRAALTAAGRGAAMRTTLTLFEEAMIGGVTNSLNGMGAALADPTIRRGENPGAEILHAGLRGFLGGAGGAALMRPFARFAQNDSAAVRAMGRSAGQALAGSGTRTAEIGYEAARGREHRRSDEVFADIFQAGAVGAFQGFAESHAEDRGRAYFQRREARAEARAAAARQAQEPVTALPPPLRPGAEEAPHTPRAAAPEPEAPRRGPVPATAATDDDAPTLRMPRPDLDEETTHQFTRQRAEIDDEPTRQMPRPVFAEDEEPTAQFRRPDLDEDAEPTQRMPRPAAAEEPEPATQRRPAAEAEPEEIQLDVGDAMMPPDARSRREAMEMFGNNVRDDPNRECAVYVNSVTGEHVIIQGNETRVFVDRDAAGNPIGVLGEGNPQRWKQILDGGDRGEWLLVAHNHPGEADASAAGWATRLPSGRGGDFSVMMYESAMMGGAVRHSVIEVTHNGRRSTTEFAYDPTSPRPFAIIYDDPATGQRVFRRFASMEAYGEFFEGLTGITPHLDQPGGPATAQGTEQIVLRHGTTAADAADIRRQGITIAEGKGRAQDFGAAFYLTPDAENAAVYATTRSERRSADEGVAHTPEVLEFRLRREDLGVLVDVRPGGEHRALWDAYLGVPRGGPPEFKPVPAALVQRMRDAGVPMPTLGDVISSSRGAEIRGAAFDHFLATIGKANADAVWGDLGGVGTGGIHAAGGGEQVAIRSPELAARLTAQLRAAAGGGGPPPPVPVPASARRPAAAVAEPPAPRAAPRAVELAPEPAAPSPQRRAIEGTAHEEPRVLPKSRIDQARDELRERFPLIDRMSDGAIERVVRAGLAHADEGGLRHGKRWGGAMRGQLLEELASVRVRALLESPDGRQALGFHPDEEGLIFIEGSRIRDESGAQITDGVIARRVGEDMQIVAVVESKAGHWAAEGLVASIKGIRGMDLPDLVEGVREASAGRRTGGIMGRLDALDPGLAAALSPRAMAALDEAGTATLRDRLLAAINRLPESELRPLKAMMQTGEGQPVRDIERLLYADDRTVNLRIHDGSGNDVAVNAGVPRRPRFVGVVPTDVGTDTIAQALVGERIAFGRLDLGPLAMTKDQLHAMATAMRTEMAGDFLAAANAGMSPAVAAPRPPPTPAAPPVPGRAAVRPPVPARALPRDYVPVAPQRPTGAESTARRAATIGLRPGDEAIMLAGRRLPQAPREEVGGALFPPAPPRGFTQRQPTSAFLLRLHADELEREQRETARRAGAEPRAFGAVPQRLRQCADALARAFPGGVDLQRPEDVEQLRQVLRAQRVTLALERPDGALDTPVVQALRRAGVRFMAPAR